MLHIFKGIVRWLFDWIYFVSLICMTGSFLGASSHFTFALCFVDTPDYGYYAALGFLHGLKYGSVWAGGLAIVLCVMRARREFLNANGLAPS
jgi:putative copper export protein